MADDEAQYDRVKRLLQRLQDEGEEAVITDNVLSETVWVLKAYYQAGKGEIVSALEYLASAVGFRLASPLRFYNALNAFTNGRGDFADYLLREQAFEAGCRTVATFDKALLTDEGFFEP